jgi:copper transport protein
VTLHRRAFLAAAVAVVAAAFLALAAGTASAHALLSKSEPAAGASLSASPSQLLLMFTEPPDPGLSSVTLLDSNGRPVHEGAVQPVPGSPTELRVPITSPLPKGAYTVSWRTVSKTDGHVTGGSFSFGVGTTPPSTVTVAPSVTPSPSVLAVAGRWLFYIGLALLTGAAAVGLFVTRRAIGRPWMLWAAWGVSVAGLVAMTLAERSTIGISLPQLLDSSTGSAFIDRGIALALLDAALVATSIRPGRATLGWLGAFAAGALLVHAVEGHADAPSSFRLANLADEWLHLVAVGAWVGGLPWLLLATRQTAVPESAPAPVRVPVPALGPRASSALDPPRTPPALDPSPALDPPEDRAETIRRFSYLATVALAITLVTGFLRALDEVRSVHPLFSTSFGVTLLVKGGLVAVLVTLGALNHFRRVPKADDEREVGVLRRTVRFEVALAAAILLAAALLSQLPPARTAAAASGPAGPQPLIVTGHDFATTTRMRLTVSPGTVGPNTFTAQVTDFDTNRPISAKSVDLEFTLPARPDIGASTLNLTHVSGSAWRGQGSMLSIFGTYSVQATVQGATSAVTVALTLRPQLPPEQISVSRATGQPTLYTISLPGGRSLQTYVDPGSAGQNAVHFTFFEPDGTETTIASARGSRVPPGGASEPMKLIRFDKGHFAANTTLAPGSWIFQISATTGDGTTLDAYFRTSIGSS